MIGSSKPEKQPGNQGTFTSKTQENHGLPTECYFWPTLSLSNELEAKLFSSPKTVVVWLTQQQKAKIEMRTG